METASGKRRNRPNRSMAGRPSTLSVQPHHAPAIPGPLDHDTVIPSLVDTARLV